MLVIRVVLLVLTLVVRVVDEIVGADVVDEDVGADVVVVVLEVVCPAVVLPPVPALVVAALPDPVTGVPDAVMAEEDCVIETAPL